MNAYDLSLLSWLPSSMVLMSMLTLEIHASPSYTRPLLVCLIVPPSTFLGRTAGLFLSPLCLVLVLPLLVLPFRPLPSSRRLASCPLVLLVLSSLLAPPTPTHDALPSTPLMMLLRLLMLLVIQLSVMLAVVSILH